METVSADLLEAPKVLKALCDDWAKRDERNVSFRSDLDEMRVLGIHILTHHAVKSSRAVLALYEAGMEAEALPIVRLVLESAVTAAWLALTPGSGQALIKEGARTKKVSLEKMMLTEGSSGYKQSVETFEFLKSLDLPGGVSVEHRALALHDGNRYYGLYRIASGYSHAGMGLMDHYAEHAEDADSKLMLLKSPELHGAREWLGITACMLLMAMSADDLARDKSRRATQLDRFAKRLGVGTELRRVDGSTLPERS